MSWISDWKLYESLTQSYEVAEKAFDAYKARAALAKAEDELNSIAKERQITNDDIQIALGLKEP